MLMLHVDQRVTGIERYYLAEEEEQVLVPDAVRKCAVFVYGRLPSGDLSPFGTAFFVGDFYPGVGFPPWGCLLTAKHVLKKICERCVDGKVHLRINTRQGGSKTVPTEFGQWIFHPEDSVDVALLHWIPPISEFDIFAFPPHDPARGRDRFGLGDEVFITGLFVNHPGEDRNIPIIRVGNISAMPEQPIATEMGPMDGYLIEARSLSGLSGSPVFVNLGSLDVEGKHRATGFGHRTEKGIKVLDSPKFFLLGLVHGHFPLINGDDASEADAARKSVNTGIAIVVPLRKAIDLIRREEERAMKEFKEQKTKAKKLPEMDSAAPEPGGTKKEFDEILKNISRPISEPDPGEKGT